VDALGVVPRAPWYVLPLACDGASVVETSSIAVGLDDVEQLAPAKAAARAIEQT
jgi:hypothetical protein